MSNDPNEYLVVSVPFNAETQLVDFLEAEGCQAFEVVRVNEACEVMLYASSNEEVDAWSEALARRFELAQIRRVSLTDEWKTGWTRFLSPVALTATLTVVPTSFVPPNEGDDGAINDDERTLWLEPGLAFGFGEHETTRMAAAWLESTLSDMPGASVLDFGCGTGILALAALRLGAASVAGIDIDDEAIRIARANARRNSVHTQCVFSTEALPSLNRDFDVVVANIDSRVLVQNAESIATRMSRHGRIAMTGFLNEHTSQVERAFLALGVNVVHQSGSGDWVLVTNWPTRAPPSTH